MPPNAGAILITVLIISSVSWVSRQIGTAFTLPNSLKRTALPSITGMAAYGPILPSPSTALPSETTATVLDLIVYLYACSLSFAMTLHGSATPGVYARARSSLVRIAHLLTVSSLPCHCS